VSAQSAHSFEEAGADREYWGRLVESAVGAHLANAAASGVCELYYWRDGNHEVDFVMCMGKRIVSIEVKSGRTRQSKSGATAFHDTFHPQRTLHVGGDGIALDLFLSKPVAHWVAA
jgi:hypothetical protein